jgi:hypothetical protein
MHALKAELLKPHCALFLLKSKDVRLLLLQLYLITDVTHK